MLRWLERRFDEVRTAEKVDVKGDVAELLGAGLFDWGGLREGDPTVDEEVSSLVASGVRPRRTLEWDEERPQVACWDLADLEEDGLSVPEAIDDWAEG